MAKLLAALLIAAVSTQLHSFSKAQDINPHDLIDEAKLQVSELRTIVTTAITIAFDRINSSVDSAYIYFENTQTQAELSIQQAHTSQITELNTIKNLVATAGKDVDACFTPESLLYKLPEESMNNYFNYAEPAKSNIDTIDANVKYRTDIVINEVDVLDFQLRQCGTEILCALPIVSRVETAMTSLPQGIETETNVARNMLEMQKMSLYAVLNSSIARINIEGRTIIEEISTCVNQILNS